jgi:hypothetical protein
MSKTRIRQCSSDIGKVFFFLHTYVYEGLFNNNNNNNNLLTADGLSPGGSGYFTFKLRQTYKI